MRNIIQETQYKQSIKQARENSKLFLAVSATILAYDIQTSAVYSIPALSFIYEIECITFYYLNNNSMINHIAMTTILVSYPRFIDDS